MAQSFESLRLSQIVTLWSIVGAAHGTVPDPAIRTAQQELLDRYMPVVYKYLRGAVRDAEVAMELSQEFALRFLRGDFRTANAHRGRFRDFLKGVLYHLIADHYRRCRTSPQPLPEQQLPAAEDSGSIPEDDQQFLSCCRNELLTRCWSELASYEQQQGQPWYSLLKFRMEHGDLRSAVLAERFSGDFGRSVSASWVRQNLRRAREKLGELLVHEVLQTLDHPTLEQLEQELIDLELIDYCRPLLKRMP